MKKYKVIFWITTGALFIFEGVLPALTSNSELARQGIMGLGYPLYFVFMLAVFKVLGSIVLIIPKFSPRVKEWAYAGFAIDFICAFTSIYIVLGPSVSNLFLPVLCFVFLVLSYISYHKVYRA